jgi:hypothetical protein
MLNVKKLDCEKFLRAVLDHVNFGQNKSEQLTSKQQQALLVLMTTDSGWKRKQLPPILEKGTKRLGLKIEDEFLSTYIEKIEKSIWQLIIDNGKIFCKTIQYLT